MVDSSRSESYDIVVIGAGPAGARAAQAAAQAGARVLLIDRRHRIGVPVRCAELVSQWSSRHAHFSSDCIIQTIETMITHLPDGTSYEMKGPGYMLDRSLFDKELVASAISAGAEILIETKAVGLSSEGVVIDQGTRQDVIRSKVVIGADGVHSLTARCLGLPPLKTIVALQCEVVNPRVKDHVDVFFHSDYEGGYAWFFPKGRTANVGMGVAPQKTAFLQDLLNQFLNFLVNSERLSGINIVGKTGGSIPCEISRQTVLGNTLLVGDAAGHAHPITGAGIGNAVIGGEIAGRIAAEAVARGDLESLQRYERGWREAFGKTLAYGATKREFLEKNWRSPEVDFETMIRKTWVGFKEYYKERKK